MALTQVISARISLASARPGIFTAGDGSPIAINSRTGALVTAASPARRGDVLVLYGTGFGLTGPAVASGNAAPSAAPLAQNAIPFRARFSSGGAEAVTQLAFSGMAPGFVAINQINVTVPANAPTGSAVTLNLENDLDNSTWTSVRISIQ
jgi:uncharacterized protein (TIGR03437 family)